MPVLTQPVSQSVQDIIREWRGTEWPLGVHHESRQNCSETESQDDGKQVEPASTSEPGYAIVAGCLL